MIRAICVLSCGAMLASSVQPASAETGAQWRQADQVFRSNSGPRGEFTYREGDYILRVPLVWSDAARIEAPVTFAIGERVVSLPAGSVLPMVAFSRSANFRGHEVLYCTPRKANERDLHGGVLGGLLGGEAPIALVRSLSDTQECLKDSDGDGRLDQALLIGEGEGDNIPGPAIEPVTFEAVKDAPISPNDEVRILLRSVGKKWIHYDLEIVQQGKKRSFDNVYSGGFSSPHLMRAGSYGDTALKRQVFGADFWIKSTDPETKTVTVMWPEGASLNNRPAIPDRWERVAADRPD